MAWDPREWPRTKYFCPCELRSSVERNRVAVLLFIRSSPTGPYWPRSSKSSSCRCQAILCVVTGGKYQVMANREMCVVTGTVTGQIWACSLDNLGDEGGHPQFDMQLHEIREGMKDDVSNKWLMKELNRIVICTHTKVFLNDIMAMTKI